MRNAAKTDVRRDSARTGRSRAGFTLVEIMTTVSIIGLLSTIGAVSYESARRYARDVRRISDMNAIQTALELYYDSHLSYPWDGAKGPGGVVLGSGQGTSLSDGGFGTVLRGSVYMIQVPTNPGPGGIPYILRSVNADGEDCDTPACPNYEVVFETEGEIAGLEPGVHVLTQGGVRRTPEAPPGTLPEVSGGFASIALEGVGQAVFMFEGAATDALANPTVKASAQDVVAPAATAGLVGIVATSAPAAQLPRYIIYFFSQPFLYLTRRRKEAFGLVYDALTKLPVDLAIVRVRDASSGAIVRSGVTDGHGRFRFIMHRGRYRLEVTKSGYVFPSPTLKGAAADGDYADLYHGGTVEVGEDSAPFTMSVPIEPEKVEESDAAVLRRVSAERMKNALALSGPVLAAASFAVVPTAGMGALVCAHVLLYLLFRRFSVPKRARDYGTVYDESTREPIQRAVLRMFAMPYHKLVSTAVTDQEGRYGFLVGPANIYVTVTKDGYEKTETDAVDLRDRHGMMTITTDLPMRRAAHVTGEASTAGDEPPAEDGRLV